MINRVKETSIEWRLAKKYNLPVLVVLVVIHHPFLFTVEKMQEDNDFKDIFLQYFGKFKIKNSIKNGSHRNYGIEKSDSGDKLRKTLRRVLQKRGEDVERTDSPEVR